MKTVLPLAQLYLKGCLRQQVHLATLFLAFLLLMLPAYVNAFSVGPEAFETISKDFGLTLIGYFIVGMGLMLGSTTVPNDLEARSVYPVLARPLSRAGFLLAHLLAAAMMLGGSLLFLGACLSFSIALILRDIFPTLIFSLYGSFLQAVVVAALCLMLSIRLRPAAAASLVALVYLLGSFSSDLVRLILGGAPRVLAEVLKALLPDFSAFALKSASVHNDTVALPYLLVITVYALGWVAFSLWLASQAFEEVDL